jgi:hypothetical protein
VEKGKTWKRLVWITSRLQSNIRSKCACACVCVCVCVCVCLRAVGFSCIRKDAVYMSDAIESHMRFRETRRREKARDANNAPVKRKLESGVRTVI